MHNNCEHRNPLQREGTTTQDRLPEALIPANVELHGLKPEDWLKFAKDYSGLLKYFDGNITDSQETWEVFFSEKDKVKDLLNRYEEGDVQPHLALFITFLKLLAYPQKSLNEIPGRHLDFYYRKILRLKPKAFTPDTVHVIFELAKNAGKELVEAKSLLEAGKDMEGNPRFYNTERDLVVNKAKIAGLKSIYKDNSNRVRYAIKSNTKDGLEEALDEKESWSAFGNENWPLAPMEFYLSSEILRLNSGQRRIIITWNPAIGTGMNILASFTQEEGWSVPYQVSFLEGNWQIAIPPDEKPVTSYQSEIHGLALETMMPVVKFQFINAASSYENLASKTITKIDIEVEVEGNQDLIVQNELGLQDPTKPFMPFGPRPKINSPLKVEVPEFKGKNVESFDFNMPWLAPPENLSYYYRHYNDPTLEEGDPDELRDDFKMDIYSPYWAGNKEAKIFPTPGEDTELFKDSVNLKGGEITFRLKKTFYHELYNKIYVATVTRTPETPVTVDELPNEPYTPLLDSLSINYKANSSVNLYSTSVSNQSIMLFQGFPFGFIKALKRVPILPVIDSKQFFTGIENLNLGEQISILFEVEEGSENPENSFFDTGEGIKWSVLKNDNSWLTLEGEHFLSNNTNNFLRSGIIKFQIPKDAGMEHSLLDKGLIWLRAELNKPVDSVPKFLGIHAQVVPATFINKQNSLDHLKGGLSSDVIKQLARRKSGIKSVQQPYPSFGGKPTEGDNEFNTRVSERLRHKDRALTIWDYEHLVLQEFPKLHKVQCLNHTYAKDAVIDELSPGNITLSVIPKITDSQIPGRIKPKTSQDLKDRILDFLNARKVLHADLHVINPVYEEVEFQFAVRFFDEYEFDFYKQKLNDELIGYLAPWVYDAKAGINFGNELYSYEVIHFIEKIEYVDFVEDFRMIHEWPDGVKKPVKTAVPSTSLSILVPAENHQIVQAIKCEV